MLADVAHAIGKFNFARVDPCVLTDRQLAQLLLDGLFIGATRAREMRNAMLWALLLSLPVAWWLQALGNHGLWLALLTFMALRGLCLGGYAYRLTRADQWFALSQSGAPYAQP